MQELVWYASYGSNINEKRFDLYIKGGCSEFINKKYEGCTDKSPPINQYIDKMNYELYFAKESSVWEKKAVAFIKSKIDKSTKTYYKAYLIKLTQFVEIIQQENGNLPNYKELYFDYRSCIKDGFTMVGKGSEYKWYGNILFLGKKDSYPIFTITTKLDENEIRYNKPGNKYLSIIIKGLLLDSKLNDEEISIYLSEKNGIKGRISIEQIRKLVKKAKDMSNG